MRCILSDFTSFVFTAGFTIGRCAEWVVHCVV